jgi:outer membrane protein assembly factor BamD
MPELSDDAERVLKRNFPDSKFLGDIEESENPSWWKFW